MSETFHALTRSDSHGPLDSQRLADFLAKDGQLLLPMLDLLEHAETAIDDLIDVMGRATVEAVLLMSAQQAAGPKQQGKKSDREVVYHGRQTGRVALKERQLRVTKPRLRKKDPKPGEPGEVEVPAYEAMRKDARLADRMRDILINGVSTRRYEHVLPEMAETVGVSEPGLPRDDRGRGTPPEGVGRAGLLGARHPGRVDRWHPVRSLPRPDLHSQAIV